MTDKQRLELLTDILSIDSTNNNETLVAKKLAEYLQKAGIDSTLVPYAQNRDNLVAEIGSGQGVLALSGHMDVVPAGRAEKWSKDPFEPYEKDGRIYARGASDMKSGLAAMAAAIIELKQDNVPINGKVRLLATVGEETGLFGAKTLREAGHANDVDALIIGEPTGHRIVYAQKGVFTYSVTSKGKTAHSSMPELGINAIDKLLVFYNRMMQEFAKLTQENSVLGKTVYCNSIINGGTQFNIVPDEATFTANLRTVPEADNALVQKILEDIISEINAADKESSLELKVTQSHSPVFSDYNSKLVQAALTQSEKMFGEKPPTLGMPGATDAAEFIKANKDMQIIIYGPGNETMHQENENMEIANYLEMIDLYKNIIIEYFA